MLLLKQPDSLLLLNPPPILLPPAEHVPSPVRSAPAWHWAVLGAAANQGMDASAVA